MADIGILDGRVDLFGQPLRAERGRGRPAHTWTPENSCKVSLLLACGHDVMDVARAVGVSKPTLYKHYFNELEDRAFAGVKFVGLQLARLNALAEQGNVAAESKLTALVEAERRKVHAARYASEPPKRTEPPKGKKDMEREAAESTEGLYAPSAPPPGVLVQ